MLQFPLDAISELIAAIAAAEEGSGQQTERQSAVVNCLVEAIDHTVELICIALQRSLLDFADLPLSFWLYLMDYHKDKFMKMLAFYQYRLVEYHKAKLPD